MALQPPASGARRLLVRRPGRLLADGIVTHSTAGPVDVRLARRQWETYVSAFADAGWTVVEVAPADDCPDAVFVEDALVVFDDLVVLTSPGAPARRAELPGAAAAADATGLRVAGIELPGTLDGGDVLKVGRTVYVGHSGRTNRAGIDQLRAMLAPRGWNVQAVPCTRVLHLKSAVTALPDGVIIGWEPAIDEPEAFGHLVLVPEESGCHVVDLGGGRLLMAEGCPLSTELVRARGFEVVNIDIGEFEKLDGCVTCLSVRIRSVGS